jgi:hypothetical protein
VGAELNPAIAAKFGEILGQATDPVRIHTGDEADALNRRIHSLACACGSDVYFRLGHYRPDLESGLELLAHELIHVYQQRCGRLQGCSAELSRKDDEFEREARNLARPIAALMSGRARVVSEAEYASLREFRSRPKRTQSGPVCRVVQRSAASLAAAAQIAPPTGPAEAPRNCHEAAMGWLLAAENYSSPWKLMRYSMNTLVAPATTASWLQAHVYVPHVKMSRVDTLGGGNATYAPAVGDLLFIQPGATPPVHSMVVVGAVGPGGAHGILVRGFNNAGTFNYPGVVSHAPPGGYDAINRDISDINLWDRTGWGFGANNAGAELHLVRYNVAAAAIRNALVHWTHSNFRGPLGGHGWQHTGGPPCPAACPH